MTSLNGLIMAEGLDDHAYQQVPSQTELLVLKTKSGTLPYPPLDNHPDIFAMNCGLKTILAPELDLHQMAASAPKLRALLKQEQLLMGEQTLGQTYPKTCLYNAITFGNFLIGRMASLDPQVIMTAKKSGLTPIDVKQGYSRCNCFTVGDKWLVTSDLGIAKAVKETLQGLGVEKHVLFCEPKTIRLNGFSHGFIGGATWQLDPGSRYFYGDIRTLDIWHQLKAVLVKQDMKPIFMQDKPLEDVGSAITINY